MKCSRELGSISSFPDGVNLYQFALAQTQLGNERESGGRNEEEKKDKTVYVLTPTKLYPVEGTKSKG